MTEPPAPTLLVVGDTALQPTWHQVLGPQQANQEQPELSLSLLNLLVEDSSLGLTEGPIRNSGRPTFQVTLQGCCQSSRLREHGLNTNQQKGKAVLMIQRAGAIAWFQGLADPHGNRGAITGPADASDLYHQALGIIIPLRVRSLPRPGLDLFGWGLDPLAIKPLEQQSRRLSFCNQ